MRYQYFFEQDRDKPVMLVALYACLRKNQAEEENHDVRELAQVAVFKKRFGYLLLPSKLQRRKLVS